LSDQRLRILWVSHLIPFPPRSGVLLRAFHLLRGVALRNDVDLFAFVQLPWLKTLYPDVQQGLDECRAELLKFCRSVTFTPIPRAARPAGRARTALESLLERNGYIAGWLRSAPAAAKMCELARNRQYDLAHFDTISLAEYRPLLGDIPCTLGHHNIESDMLLRRADNETSAVRRWYFAHEARKLRRFEVEMAPSFRAHITCSELDSKRLSAIAPGSRTIVAPNGVDCEYFKPQGADSVPDTAIFIGTMNWYPNVEAVRFLLESVWPEVRRAKSNAQLDIVGANAPEVIRRLASAVGGVTVHGFVNEIRPMMERAALYICPIRDGGGTKLKVLDACAMARCIVAHPTACEGIALKPGSEVVYAVDAAQTVSEVLRLFDDAPARARIGVAARKVMERDYSFQVIAANLAVEFAKLAAE
jgi:glycosyltransferase involved in cell wall biosynthesis